MLQKQKTKTGFAILGHPIAQIILDKNTKGEIQHNSQLVGEQLALTVLQTELFVLDIAGIKQNQFRHYIGRSQFPQFSKQCKTLRAIPDYIKHGDTLVEVAKAKQNIITVCSPKLKHSVAFRQLGAFSNVIQQDIAIEAPTLTFGNKPVHEMLPVRDWLILAHVLSGPKATIQLLKDELLDILSILEDKLSRAAAHAATQEWINYVKKCLAKGGSKMFAYISKEVKAYMSIDNHSLYCKSYSPDKHLAAQKDTWEARWHPAHLPELNNAINHLLVSMRKAALADHDTQKALDTTQLKAALCGYAKETKGIDMWLPSELRALPDFLKQLIASSISYSFKKAVQPIQNLTNLQAMLGKPGGGSRTISKTPVLYRMSLRGRHEVEEWEEDYTGDFDTAGKGKSALLAAAYRSLEAEVYNYTEEQVIGVFSRYG